MSRHRAVPSSVCTLFALVTYARFAGELNICVIAEWTQEEVRCTKHYSSTADAQVRRFTRHITTVPFSHSRNPSREGEGYSACEKMKSLEGYVFRRKGMIVVGPLQERDRLLLLISSKRLRTIAHPHPPLCIHRSTGTASSIRDRRTHKKKKTRKKGAPSCTPPTRRISLFVACPLPAAGARQTLLIGKPF